MVRALQTACEANNLGVELLKDGRYREALNILRGSADLLYSLTQDLKKQILHKGVGHTNTRETSDASDDKKMKPIQDKIEALLNTYEDGDKQRRNKRQRRCRHHYHCHHHFEEKDEFMICEGIQLSPHGTSSTTCALESATILFNMALSYHSSASYSVESAPLQNALTLYEMACSVALRVESQQNHHQQQQESPQQQCVSRVVMASLNNIGQIYHRLGKYDRSRDYLDDLSHYILQSTASSSVLNNQQKEILRERRHFLLNAMLLHEPRGAPAA